MRNPIRRARLALAALCWAIASAGACAQAVYPRHAVKLIVPWPAGGSVDIAARVIAEQLSVNLGQPVIVDNRPGAAGNIGATMAAQSAPDGYTLLMATTAMIINRSLYRNLPFDLARDFTPVSQLVTLSYVLVAHPSVANSVPELIAKAKANPGQLSYASSGPGTQLHLIGEGFKRQAGIDIVHVPYKGAPPALADMLGGHVHLMFPGFPVVEPLLKSGQLKALAVVSKRRLALLPNVPTLAQVGVPNLHFTEWYGVVAPAGTPDKIVAQLNGEIVKILKMPDVRQRLAGRGFDPVGGTSQEFAELILAEQKKWAATVAQSGVRVDE
ncbi:Bug family tripartite tricarboxylate transporter substrate binding protein [Verminephrobacter eiseniae]|uniref:Bug family tripartite tricarboxylate transporter substrate binding protein n=1 Tax=Verminephrobacter eiseniae TaxID=364317 RepID=UPI00223703DE|nr:tripartite tricarboxylate transporter substrate binding protein [Verminephrobacter eiseniae]MCW5237636.1 tripartite tricarboxylate transporter substrate binding protein [Verminephrobacter eiseniae]